MVVAGDHANNDMAGEDEDSWKSQFAASGNFDSVDTQIAGLGEIEAVQKLYVEHTKKAIESLGKFPCKLNSCNGKCIQSWCWALCLRWQKKQMKKNSGIYRCSQSRIPTVKMAFIQQSLIQTAACFM